MYTSTLIDKHIKEDREIINEDGNIPVVVISPQHFVVIMFFYYSGIVPLP